VIRGSRLLQHFLDGWSAGTNIASSSGTRAKAAPLQALGTNTPRQPADRFQDEHEKILPDLIDVQPQLHKDRKKKSEVRSAKVGENSNASLEPKYSECAIFGC
jgi:membrane-bound ClpP family serine protease